MHKLFFDAGLKNNEISYGIIIKYNDVNIYKTNGKVKNKNFTSNTAEYLALTIGLVCAHSLGIKNIAIYGDSLMVVNQVNKKCKIKSASSRYFANTIRELCSNFESYTLEWLPRKDNKEAHREGR
jgi:ribonuclease HI